MVAVPLGSWPSHLLVFKIEMLLSRVPNTFGWSFPELWIPGTGLRWPQKIMHKEGWSSRKQKYSKARPIFKLRFADLKDRTFSSFSHNSTGWEFECGSDTCNCSVTWTFMCCPSLLSGFKNCSYHHLEEHRKL